MRTLNLSKIERKIYEIAPKATQIDCSLSIFAVKILAISSKIQNKCAPNCTTPRNTTKSASDNCVKIASTKRFANQIAKHTHLHPYSSTQTRKSKTHSTRVTKNLIQTTQQKSHANKNYTCRYERRQKNRIMHSTIAHAHSLLSLVSFGWLPAPCPAQAFCQPLTEFYVFGEFYLLVFRAAHAVSRLFRLPDVDRVMEDIAENKRSTIKSATLRVLEILCCRGPGWHNPTSFGREAKPFENSLLRICTRSQILRRNRQW